MSRSRRTTPAADITTVSTDHPWKKAAARTLRRAVRQSLKATLDGDRFAGKRWDLVDPWTSDKDGKFWFGWGVRNCCASSVSAVQTRPRQVAPRRQPAQKWVR